MLELILTTTTGPAATLLVALAAAWTTYRITELKARRQREHETIISLRKAYVDWYEAVGAFAKKDTELHLAVMEGAEEHPMETLLNDVHLKEQLTAKSAVVRILDPIPDPLFDAINDVMLDGFWNPQAFGFEIGKDNIFGEAYKQASDMFSKTADRLLSNEPFKCDDN